MTNYSLDSLLDEFESYLVNKEAKAEITPTLYAADLKLLLPIKEYENYESLVNILTKRVNSIDDWDNSKRRTKYRRVCSANSLCRFLEKTGKIEKANPYPNKKIERTPLCTIQQEEFSKLMDVIPFDKYTDAKDRAAFSLMFYNGLRESEAVSLEYKNFVRDSGIITHVDVYGKYKIRRLKVNKTTAKALMIYEESYNEDKRELPPLEEAKYFKNKHGKRISTRSLRRKFKKYVDKAGIEAKPASLRFSYAQEQIAKGADKKELAYLMGVLESSAKTMKKLLRKT